MSSEPLPDELKEFLQSRGDYEDHDQLVKVAACHGMAWDRKHDLWVIRVDGKRTMELGRNDVPDGMDIRTTEFIDHIMRVMRNGGIEGLKTHLLELKCSDT